MNRQSLPWTNITDKLTAVGKEAQQMQGEENERIRTVRPLRKGVIADLERC